MPTLPFGDDHPQVAPDCYLAPTGFVVGSVTMGSACSVWFGSVVRGDSASVRLGSGVNVQEGGTIHTEPGHDVEIGDDVSLGHHALVHGAIVDSEVLIGINASVLTGARIASGSIIGAHALVPEGKEIPPRSLVLGTPGKVVRTVTDDEYERILRTARNYRGYAVTYAAASPQPGVPEGAGR